MKRVTELERQVWAAAFAAEFVRDSNLLRQHGRASDAISGFSCAEVADVALEKFRKAMACEDAGYLTPVKESWTDDD